MLTTGALAAWPHASGPKGPEDPVFDQPGGRSLGAGEPKQEEKQGEEKKSRAHSSSVSCPARHPVSQAGCATAPWIFLTGES